MSTPAKIISLFMLMRILFIPVAAEAAVPELPAEEAGTPESPAPGSFTTALPGSQRNIYSTLFPPKKSSEDLINEDSEEGRVERNLAISMGRMEYRDSSHPNAQWLNTLIDRAKELVEKIDTDRFDAERYTYSPYGPSIFKVYTPPVTEGAEN